MKAHRTHPKLALVTAAMSLAFAGSVAANPIATPYWEIEYDLDGSTLTQDTQLGTIVSDLGPGTLTLQVQDLGASSDARLSTFDLDLLFDLFGIVYDLEMSMTGDANGTFSPGTGTIQWSTPADGWTTAGFVTCNASALICGNANLPIGVPLEINESGTEPVGDLELTSPQQNSSIAMTWESAVAVLSADAQSPGTLTIVGTETSRTLVGGPVATPTATPQPGSAPSKCDALKTKFVGKKVACRTNVFAKAAKKAESPDTEKLGKCDTKFAMKCQKAEEKKDDCSVLGNCAALGAAADAAADTLRGEVLLSAP